MNCLYCGKPINDNSSDEEKQSWWHAECVRSFFKTDKMPLIDVDKSELESLARITVEKGLTVPGVQKKLSLHLSKTDNIPRLTLVDYPAGYILKPQSAEYDALPESESFAMKLAAKVGIKTVPNALIRMNKQKGTPLAYITRRVDRGALRGKPSMLAMEDFCQLGERLTRDKYKSSYERVGKILQTYSSNPGVDSVELYMRLIYCFLIGNSDMHLKNFSLIETEPGSRKYVLSPAYDLLTVNVLVPSDPDETALTLNGKKKNLTRNDFLAYADTLRINSLAAKKMIDKMTDMYAVTVDALEDSYMPDSMKENQLKLMNDRFRRLKK